MSRNHEFRGYGKGGKEAASATVPDNLPASESALLTRIARARHTLETDNIRTLAPSRHDTESESRQVVLASGTPAVREVAHGQIEPVL